MVVAQLAPELSRSQATRLASDGRVAVNGTAVKASTRVRPGDRLTVDVPPPADVGLAAEDIPLTVVHMDEQIIVIDKPAGLVVHPAPGHPGGTLANALLSLDPEIAVGMGRRPGIVHRLDRDTSGLIVVARTDSALRALQAQFAARGVKKVDLALVRGRPRNDEAVVEAPIGRDPRDRKRMAIVQSGRAASTRFLVRERFKNSTLLEVTIATGRTHQIRVHLASVGHPVVGDHVYGRGGGGRLFLHAAELGFKHPATGEWLELQSPLPPELEAILRLESRA